MFNIFKKSPKVAAVTSNEYPAVVQEIHKSFLTAGDRLLKEAKSIIANAEIKDEEKISRLKKIGFVNAGQVKSAESAIQKKKQAESDAAIVESYAIKYPQYKFITEAIVAQICEKYKLIMGDISKYSGFVPEKNLSDIEQFKVKDEDCREEHYHVRDFFDREITSRQMEQIGSLLSLGQANRSQMEREFYFQQQAALRLSDRPKYKPTPEPPTIQASQEPKIKTTFKREFVICAPQKDMKLESWERVEGHKIVLVPDPVVLHPVKNGYLIVTAWGDEASDGLVVNQTNN